MSPRCARRSRTIARPASSRFWWSASAGTVDIGAIDDLKAIAELCRERGNSGFTSTAPSARSRSCRRSSRRGSRGIERADSIALDFHKWGQVPYDAGFLLVRDGEQHRRGLCAAGGLSAPRDARACGGRAVALRSRPRSVARLPRAEDLVHAEDVRHRPARRGDLAQLRAGAISGERDAGRAAARIAGAGATQHRLLPLPRRRCRRSIARSSPTLQESGVAAPSTHDAGRQARDPRGDRQSPHRRDATSMRWWLRCWSSARGGPAMV